MQLYQNLQQVSTKLIRQFGSPCVISQGKTGKYNPETGEVSQSKRRVSASCLFDTLAYDFSRQTTHADVQVGDVLMLLTEKAEVNDIVSVNGEKWQVIRVQPIRPAQQAIYYQAQGRRYG